MNARAPLFTVLFGASLLVPAAAAQPTITWYTIACGGGTSVGGAFTLTGTIGQHDASPPSTGGTFTLTGGFWPGIGACPADFDGSGTVNSADITAFITAWLQSVQLGTTVADFDGNGVTNSADITAFITAWLHAVQNGC